ncbi:MAG TPA: ABC transporter substrate-binding protein, partial [Actinomycetaceae bacterium]|nr:ABC transporter substrate-binding protein [Actinomycetaceae bacterium]
STTYATWNSVVNNRVQSSFTYFGTDGTIHPNEELGTFEAVSEDPLIVEYTIHEDAVWSDGEPIDYADAVFRWATQNPNFADDEGAPLFDAVSHALGEYVPTPPEGEMGGKDFTLNYETPYADWQLLIDKFYPAHVVARELGLSTEEFTQAILDEDMDVITEAAEFWDSGWDNPQPGQLPDEELIPVSGPYTYSNWEAGQYITLEANEAYWGTPPATSRLTFRFMDASTHVQALENGDLNVSQGQATVDTLEQLEALGEGFALQTGDTLTWEHLDFNFNRGVFSDEEGGLELREAFAKCVPREQIVNNLIKPISEDAVVMNAREVFPFQDDYEDVVSQAYDGQYDEVDLAGAEQLIDDSGIDTPIDVRITYTAGNTRRSDQVAAIKSSCDQIGFNIIDSGTDDFSDRFFTGSGEPWEVALFAWAGSGQIASGRNIYMSGMPQNGGGFANEELDEAWRTLSNTADEAVHAEQRPIIERILWENLHGIPLFAHPGVIGYDSSIDHIRFTAAQDQVPWNAEQWARAE